MDHVGGGKHWEKTETRESERFRGKTERTAKDQQLIHLCSDKINLVRGRLAFAEGRCASYRNPQWEEWTFTLTNSANILVTQGHKRT